ncbi:hypothetical protein ACIZQU_004588 [Escherichia coli]|uniref:hypothetical protein n=1 Tax=Enterobacteriaceae TaxID=543 RepID=UPI0012FF87DA|nr:MULTISPECIES: hypothetical protein [Enterobacteriaceae]EEC2408325.1 hypothetical protein [Salmonella enterica subsp. enterica serovar Enteritidis]EEP8173212.1 hypothetical protein [Salmonella enterica subsp. diarizonae]EGC7331592.1 hypothetical protein [Salmonella enterica subsp. enterica serovar Typhimurium]EHX9271470.1 hypothetical protein [Salmonella enterica subsp. enterica serovar Agona]EIJ3244186.1 hypothetical protein [Salmonella enterica subsp. enterica serovar Newport]EIK5700687.1
MFDVNVEVENKEFKALPFSPSNLKLIKDKKGKSFVFQLECIVAIEPFFDITKKECDVITSMGERIRVCMAVDELYAALDIQKQE